MPNKNTQLMAARKNKNDEFYTLFEDIAAEMAYYKQHFAGKIIYCNCDDYEKSNFVKYFRGNFEKLQLKGLIATSYNSAFGGKGKMMRFSDINPNDGYAGELDGNGSYRSKECLDLLEEADIVITNPPFSQFRQFAATLENYDKKFIIMGNLTAVSYKHFFQRLQNNEVWTGKDITNGDREFAVPSDYPLEANGVRIDASGQKFIRIKSVRWFTNLENDRQNDKWELSEKYEGNESHYPKYENYDAINIDKMKDLPVDYDGVIGVPITFFDRYCPEQFEVVGVSRKWDDTCEHLRTGGERDCGVINGEMKYTRVFVKWRRENEQAKI